MHAPTRAFPAHDGASLYHNNAKQGISHQEQSKCLYGIQGMLYETQLETIHYFLAGPAMLNITQQHWHE